MSCLNFDFMLVGQALVDEATCSGAYKRASKPSPSPRQKHSSLSSPLQQSHDSLCFYSSFLTALRHDLSLYESDTGAASPRPSSPSALYSIREEEEEEEGEEADDDDEDEEGHAFDVPFLRFFKSCFVQFAYMMPMDKTGAASPRPSSPSALYSIREEEGEEADDDDEDEDEEGHAFDVPFLRFFKSCFVQFAYLMP